MQGIVKSFDRNRGFGFITAENGDEIFVHHTDIADSEREYLTPGQGVRFNVMQTARGPRAVKVHIIQEVPSKGAAIGLARTTPRPPRAGEVPKAVLRARGILPDEDEEEESSRKSASDEE